MTGQERKALVAIGGHLMKIQDIAKELDERWGGTIATQAALLDVQAHEALRLARAALAAHEETCEGCGMRKPSHADECPKAIDAHLDSFGYPAAREEPMTVWTCMSCGQIGDRQSCGNCGHEAMPGRWLEAESVERQLKDAWQQRDDARTILIDSEALAAREEPPTYDGLLSLERQVLDVTEPVAGVMNGFTLSRRVYKAILGKVEESARAALAATTDVIERITAEREDQRERALEAAREVDEMEGRLAARLEPREHVAERIGRLAEMSTDELIAINIRRWFLNRDRHGTLCAFTVRQGDGKNIEVFAAREDTERPCEIPGDHPETRKLAEMMREESPRNQLQAIMDFLDSWRYCPVSSSDSASRQCLEKAARELLIHLRDAREATEQEQADG